MDPWGDGRIEGRMPGWMGGQRVGCLVWEMHKAHCGENSKHSCQCGSTPAAVKVPERSPAMALGKWGQRRQAEPFQVVVETGVGGAHPSSRTQVQGQLDLRGDPCQPPATGPREPGTPPTWYWWEPGLDPQAGWWSKWRWRCGLSICLNSDHSLSPLLRARRPVFKSWFCPSLLGRSGHLQDHLFLLVKWSRQRVMLPQVGPTGEFRCTGFGKTPG